MIEVGYLTRVPVAMLRPGLYVAALDRPWTDVPVPFQGFEIRTEEELRVLRQHCQFVYVEGERSREEAYTRLQSEIQGTVPEGGARPGETDLSAVLGRARHPAKQALARRVAAAARLRAQARDYLERALSDVRLGHAVDARQARELVEEMATEVAGNASAHMWLTNLRKIDEYTTVHSLNVCVLSLAFGLYLRLPSEQLYRIGVGALLHDIGKVNQAPALLTKTTPLNAFDWQQIRRHPDEGYDLASRSADLPREALEIIRMHHERLDGLGFPRGLQGEEIPYHVRIVALVNLYDSLTAERPYRRGRPAHEVLHDLYSGRDKTFGAELVEAFIRCIGIYPVGSLVELDDGALAVVVGSSPDSRLRPTVLLLRSPQGQRYRNRALLNLGAEPVGEGPVPARRVRRVVSPASEGLDVGGIIDQEFGLAF